MAALLLVFRGWSRRRWTAAGFSAFGSFLALGLPTALIPNPVFARPIEPPAWASLSLVVTALLSGLLIATFVSDRRTGESHTAIAEATPQEARTFTAGGVLAFFAIGCPTCNKLVLLALGTSGAITWFEPVQPFLGLVGIAVLIWVLRRRLLGELACRVPAARR